MIRFFEKVMLLIVCLWCSVITGVAQNSSQLPDMGKAAAFHVIADRKVTNIGVTTVAGKLAVADDYAVLNSRLIGLIIDGLPHLGDPIAKEAHADLNSFYKQVFSLKPDRVLRTSDLTNTLAPGVYKINGSVKLSGSLTLNGGPNDSFIFLIDGDLTVEQGAQVGIAGGISPGNVFWVSSKNVNVFNEAYMWGSNLVAAGSIDLKSGAYLLGRAWSVGGSIDFDNNILGLPADLSVGLRSPRPQV